MQSDDINTPLVAVFGVISAVAVFAIIVAIQVLYFNYEQLETQRKVVDVPAAEANNLIAEQEARLNQMGWLDRANGRIAIPIDRAMKSVTEELRNEQREANDGT